MGNPASPHDASRDRAMAMKKIRPLAPPHLTPAASGFITRFPVSPFVINPSCPKW